MTEPRPAKSTLRRLAPELVGAVVATLFCSMTGAGFLSFLPAIGVLGLMPARLLQAVREPAERRLALASIALWLAVA